MSPLQFRLGFQVKHLLWLVVVLVLAGCSTATPTSVPPTIAPTFVPTQALPTATLASAVQATPIMTPTIVLTQTVRPATPLATTSRATVTPVAPGSTRVKLFFVALEDKGKSGKKIGCDDSVVAVDHTMPTLPGILNATLRDLFSIHDKTYGASGLHNALADSDLKVESVSIINTRAEIRLTGSLKLGGVCDGPRVDAQIKETALQFSTVKSVAVWVNGKTLESLLSQK